MPLLENGLVAEPWMLRDAPPASRPSRTTPRGVRRRPATPDDGFGFLDDDTFTYEKAWAGHEKSSCCGSCDKGLPCEGSGAGGGRDGLKLKTQVGVGSKNPPRVRLSSGQQRSGTASFLQPGPALSERFYYVADDSDFGYECYHFALLADHFRGFPRISDFPSPIAFAEWVLAILGPEASVEAVFTILAVALSEALDLALITAPPTSFDRDQAALPTGMESRTPFGTVNPDVAKRATGRRRESARAKESA